MDFLIDMRRIHQRTPAKFSTMSPSTVSVWLVDVKVGTNKIFRLIYRWLPTKNRMKSREASAAFDGSGETSKGDDERLHDRIRLNLFHSFWMVNEFLRQVARGYCYLAKCMIAG